MLIYSTMYQPYAAVTLVLSSLCWLGWVVSGGEMSGVELLALRFDGPAWLVGVAAMFFQYSHFKKLLTTAPVSAKIP